ncbi:MAG: ATP synthase F1 subunit gamma [Verrucomicrobiota bacterium]
MPSTRDIRRRIKSVKNTAQITKAMQMVAASRMRKAQQQALAGHPYLEMMNHIGLHLRGALLLNDFHHPLIERRPRQRVGKIVITTDRGLCGALNANLLRLVNDDHDESEQQIFYVSVGRKGRQFLARTQREMSADFEIKDNFSFRDSRRASLFLMDKFIDGSVDAVEVYFNKFVNTIVQEPIRIPLLPLGMETVGQDPAAAPEMREYLFEPSAPELLGKLLPYFVHMMFYQMLLDSKASEHSARMVAMKNATDNAKQMIKDLTLDFNKLRQAAITTELLEISTAQMSLD